MNGDAAERLYQLLPAHVRVRDAGQGMPLKAVIGVLAEQAQVLEEDIARLNDNWFIETCDEWVVSYIADLLGVRGLHPISAANFTLRGYVANTLSYRRRKGTAAVLEQLARDTTGWPARAVEYFRLLAASQYLNHVVLSRPGTADLRDTDGLDLLGTPFERAPRSAEVRHISSSRGKYNIPYVGLSLWRLQAYPLSRVTARGATKPPDARYTFSPLRNDAPLFNRPQTEEEITHFGQEQNVPGRLRRLPLYNELVARRRDLAVGRTLEAIYFGETPALEIFLGGKPEPVRPEQIVICNLSGWEVGGWKPPASKNFPGPDNQPYPTLVAVDPVLGRLALLDGAPQRLPVEVSYAYGFSADIGGGPYNRQETAFRDFSRRITWQAGVSKEKGAVGGELIFDTLAKAVEEWNKQPAGTIGLIAILDSRTYVENLTGAKDTILVPENSELLIVAADWPVINKTTRMLGQFAPDELRPHLLGDVSVRGTAGADSPNPGRLALNGLLAEGTLSVLAGDLGSLQLTHCTLAPANGGLGVNASASAGKDEQNARLQISIQRSICGPVRLPASVPDLRIVDSIVDQGKGAAAIVAPGATVGLDASTVFGISSMRALEASNSIFTGVVSAERRQTGCVRFSFVPDGSLTPRRFRCQPELALSRRAKERGLDSAQQLPQREKDVILAQVRPQFNSIEYGQPDYGQFARACAIEIRAGADNGSEMGVFSSLKQPQREANLLTSLDEYLPVGLEAGLFFVT